MSSHHFVKEGQEPALLIIDTIPVGYIEPLLEWAPLVIVFDHSLDQVLQYGIKVDVVVAITSDIGDLMNTLDHQMPVKVLSCLSGEDPVVKSLDFLTTTKQSSVNIVTHHPDEIMHLIDRHRVGIDVSLITSTIRWSFIASGEFRKWFPSGSNFRIRAESNVTINSNAGAIALDLSGNEKTVDVPSDGIVSVKAGSGFWVGEE